MTGKKYLVAFLLLIFLEAGCNMGSPYGASAFKEKIIGHVAKLMDSTWYINSDSSAFAKNDYLVKVYSFNQEGSVTAWATHAPGINDSAAGNLSLFDVSGQFSEDLLLQRDRRLGIKMKDENAGNSGLMGEAYAITQDGRVYKRYSRKFDDNFNLLEITQFNPDSGITAKYSFTYDADKKVIEAKQYDGSAALVKQIKYTYDTNGLEVGYTVYDVNGQLTDQYTFTYSDHDEVGNWGKRSCYKNNKPFAVTIRRIAYYD